MKNILLTLISCPFIYICLAFIIVIIDKPSLSYINIGKIIKSYYKDILLKHKLIKLFVLIPLLLAQALNYVAVMNLDINENISVSISILISMFFAYIAFYDERKYIATNDASRTQIQKTISAESKIILSYEILISVILLVLSMFYQLFYDNDYIIFKFTHICKLSTFGIYSLVMYALFIHLILNLLVLLKRYDLLKDR